VPGTIYAVYAVDYTVQCRSDTGQALGFAGVERLVLGTNLKMWQGKRPRATPRRTHTRATSSSVWIWAIGFISAERLVPGTVLEMWQGKRPRATRATPRAARAVRAIRAAGCATSVLTRCASHMLFK
jgi:hypothetical protein